MASAKAGLLLAGYGSFFGFKARFRSKTSRMISRKGPEVHQISKPAVRNMMDSVKIQAKDKSDTRLTKKVGR